MNIAVLVARILIGVLFVFAGAMAFFINPSSMPRQPGLVGEFNHAFYGLHYAMFVGAVQIVLGVLLLMNRYVPLALVMLAAFLYNSFAYHITTSPVFLPLPIVGTLLGLLIASKYRSSFAPLFVANPGRSSPQK